MAITFRNIRTGERKTVDTEPLIAAFFNSSDQHVNARLGQDFGWRLDVDTIARMREIQNDQNTMDRIAQQFSLPMGEVADTDIIRWISIEDARKEAAKRQEEVGDHEAEYQRELRELDEGKTSKKSSGGTRKVSRDAGDGQFVSKEEAKSNPKTTVTETVKGNNTNSEKQSDSAKIDASSNDSKES